MHKPLSAMLEDLLDLVEIKVGQRPDFGSARMTGDDTPALRSEQGAIDWPPADIATELESIRNDLYQRVHGDVLSEHLKSVGREIESLWLKVIRLEEAAAGRVPGPRNKEKAEAANGVKADGVSAFDVAHELVFGAPAADADRAYWLARDGNSKSFDRLVNAMRAAAAIHDDGIWLRMGLADYLGLGPDFWDRLGPKLLVLACYRHFAGFTLSGPSVVAILKGFVGHDPTRPDIVEAIARGLGIDSESLQPIRAKLTPPRNFRGWRRPPERFSDDAILRDITLIELALAPR